MKTKYSILLACACAGLLVAGCASVPSTKLAINPTTGAVSLDSPKEIAITNLNVTLANGVSFVLQGYHSNNSPDVIATVAAANAQMADKLIQLMNQMSALAAKGATGGVAP